MLEGKQEIVIVVLPRQVEGSNDHSSRKFVIHLVSTEKEKREDSSEKWTTEVTCMYHCLDQQMETLAVFLSLSLISQNE